MYSLVHRPMIRNIILKKIEENISDHNVLRG